jgi:signal transduction histidine kinase
MTNAFRHAGATRIDVSLRFETPTLERGLSDSGLGGFVIRAADNGRGLQGETEAGMGLAGMRDRVRLLGGQVTIASPPEGGVVVEARFGAAGAASEREKFPANSGTNPRKSSKD